MEVRRPLSDKNSLDRIVSAMERKRVDKSHPLIIRRLRDVRDMYEDPSNFPHYDGVLWALKVVNLEGTTVEWPLAREIDPKLQGLNTLRRPGYNASTGKDRGNYWRAQEYLLNFGIRCESTDQNFDRFYVYRDNQESVRSKPMGILKSCTM